MEARNLKGLGLFGQEAITLISKGKHETKEEIMRQMENGTIIEYIAEKYDSDLMVKFDNKIYDNKSLNAYFSEDIDPRSNKVGVFDDSNGLLLIPAFVLWFAEDKTV